MSRRSVKIAEISKRVQVRKKHEEEEEEEDDKEEEEEDEEEEWVERKKKIDVAGAKKGANAQRPRCQADDCDADMGAAKRYFRRHRLCEEHFKAAIVVVRGLNQRFCQQCSRFHEISQFDDVKRSCRRRLAGHNERRRKAQNNSHHQPDAVNDGSSNGETPYPKYPTWRPPSQSVHMHIAGVRENAFKHFHIRQHLKRNRWLKGAKTSKFEKYRLRGGGLLEWFSCRRCFRSACVPIPDSSKEGSTLLVFPIRS